MKHKLQEINFHITEYCSGHCPMCYATEENMIRHHGEFETLKQIIHNGIVCGDVGRFVMVGGDPCEHPNLVELLKFIKQENVLYNKNVKATIISNTHDYKENGKPVNIKKVVHYIDGICATIHGATAEEHDAFNGCKGSYEHLIQNMQDYIKLKDKSQKVCIILNLMPQVVNNLKQIIESINMRLEGNVDGFALQRIAPIGRACGENKYFIEPKDVNLIMATCSEMKTKYGFFMEFVDAFPLCRVNPKYWNMLTKGGCNWGTDFCAVFSDGSISRCAMSENKLSSNILELNTPQKFSDFWDNDKELNLFRNKKHLGVKCNKCSLLSQCGGGCALARTTGDPYKTPTVEEGYDYLSVKSNEKGVSYEF